MQQKINLLLVKRNMTRHDKILEYYAFFYYYVIQMENNTLKEKVEKVLEKVRTGLRSEGGDIEFVDLKENVVYVKLMGACGTCPMSTLTMKNWVETTIKKEIPEVKAVQAVE
jgi:Fe-S cluster biogenesis protein NfuA